MKIMHTSDWRLGLSSEGVSRKEEQIEILNEICHIADEKQVDVVLVAGNVFCGINTPAYADELLATTLLKLSNNGNRAVVVISGNDDESERFVTTKNFALTKNIYLLNSLNTDFENEFLPKNSNVKLVGQTKGGLVFEKNGERLAIAFMPYPSNYFANEKTKEGEEAVQKLKRIFEQNAVCFEPNAFNVALAHFFVPYKNVKSDFYFEATTNVFPQNANYVALGHIHDFAEVDPKRNIYYSGSTIQSFEKEDSSKYVIVLETADSVLKAKEFVKLKVPKKFVKVIAQSYEQACQKLADCENCLAKVYLSQDAISPDEIKSIYKMFKFVIACVLIPKTQRAQFKFSNQNVSPEELLSKFYSKNYAKKPSANVVQCFLEALEKEEQNETY